MILYLCKFIRPKPQIYTAVGYFIHPKSRNKPSHNEMSGNLNKEPVNTGSFSVFYNVLKTLRFLLTL